MPEVRRRDGHMRRERRKRNGFKEQKEGGKVLKRKCRGKSVSKIIDAVCMIILCGIALMITLMYNSYCEGYYYDAIRAISGEVRLVCILLVGIAVYASMFISKWIKKIFHIGGDD